jgi:multidrug efflux pump subunit AcrB
MLERILGRHRLFLTATVLLSLTGAVAWQTMPRQEDPRWPNRDGLVTVRFQGAAPEALERLVLDPIEDALIELEELEKFVATARAGVVLVHVKLDDSIYETELAWDEVERALAEARREFPEGVGEPVLDRDPYAPESIVVALTGSPDPLALADAADRLRRELLAIPSVAKVERVGDPGEQILIELDAPISRRLGITHRELADALARRNVTTPSGSVRVGDRQLVLRPRTEFETVSEIRQTPIALVSGAAVPLGTLSRIRRAPAEPPRERMRFNGVRAVGLTLTPARDVDMVALGESVRRALAKARPRHAPLDIHEVFFQPDQVERRIGGLGRSLLLGVAIVAAVLCASMGLRMGLVVALVIPLVVLSSLAIYAAGGGVLHQMSVAGLVISLGLLVDNVIIIVENLQREVDEGTPVSSAAVASVRQLAVPLASATGTTLAAFVPLLLAQGISADFIRSLPIVVMLTVGMSFLFALLVTPTFARAALRKRTARGHSFFEALAQRTASIAVHRPGRNLALAACLLGVSLLATRLVEQDFFPSTDRSQILVDVSLPEGSHLDGTDRAARALEAALLARPDVVSVAAFIGRDTPLFYYNLPRRPSSPHLAQLIVQTTDRERVLPLQRWIRDFSRRGIPEALIIARRLEQGRTVQAPIEVRLSGGSFAELQSSAERVVAALRDIEGCQDVRHDLGVGVPALTIRVDDASAQRFGASRADVALALLTQTRGLEVGQLRGGEDPVPIVVRPSAGEEMLGALLPTVGVAVRGGATVPLGQLGTPSITWIPGAIHHRNHVPTVTVYAQLAEGIPYSRVLGKLSARVVDLALPASVRLEWGGEAEGSSKANTSILRVLPLAILLLLLFILAEFNSFRSLAIVLVTLPMAAIGIVPGLLLSGQPFGFMSFLGVVSLLGIVVNNAIVLLDVVERSRREGRSIAESLHRAVVLRTRPILLTTLTTAAGLLPLAFSSSPLWPPLAWAIISGLLASTVLTLVVVPSLYACLFREPLASSPGSR